MQAGALDLFTSTKMTIVYQLLVPAQCQAFILPNTTVSGGGGGYAWSNITVLGQL